MAEAIVMGLMPIAASGRGEWCRSTGGRAAVLEEQCALMQ